MNEDTEVFCNNCFAGMESSEHHQKCVRPREELQERIVDIIDDADNNSPIGILGDQYGAGPNLTEIAAAVLDGLGLHYVSTEQYARIGLAWLNNGEGELVDKGRQIVGRWEKK